MGQIALIGNEIKKITAYVDNSVEIVLNVGEIPDTVIQELYKIKKSGEFKILLANIPEWPIAVTEQAHILVEKL